MLEIRDWRLQTIDRSIYLSIFLSIYLSIDRSIDLSIYRFIDLSIYRFIDLSIYRSIDLSIYRSIYRFIYLSIYISRCIYWNLATSLLHIEFLSDVFFLQNVGDFSQGIEVQGPSWGHEIRHFALGIGPADLNGVFSDGYKLYFTPIPQENVLWTRFWVGKVHRHAALRPWISRAVLSGDSLQFPSPKPWCNVLDLCMLFCTLWLCCDRGVALFWGWFSGSDTFVIHKIVSICINHHEKWHTHHHHC